MSTEARFRVGDYVQRVNQPELAGIVRELRWEGQVECWNYLVQFGAQLRAVPEEALEVVAIIESVWDSLECGKLSGKTHFVFTLTYERLKSPPARIAHSFATARTQFYPYQFKPLLKFLDNPGKSVLIADDVGLGKTIEAAYILRQLDAHQAIERVLVVVPARLRSKRGKKNSDNVSANNSKLSKVRTSYRESWQRKKKWYKANGFDKLLITSEDGPDGRIDAAEIDRIARTRILGES